MDEEAYWVLRIHKPWVKRGIAFGIVFFVLYVLSIGMVCDYTDRTRTTSMLSVASGVKQQITDFMLANPGKPVKMDAQALIPERLQTTSKEGDHILIPFREVTSSGEIRMFSPQLGTMVILTPALSGNKVKWTCWGRPEKKVPANCRP